MSIAHKPLRIPMLAAVLCLAVLASMLGASSARADDDIKTCAVSCSKTLTPGDRLVIGDRYARSAVSAGGSANGFGVRFGLKWSPDGVNFYRLMDTEQVTTSYFKNISKTQRPDLFPGYFRLVALNTSTWLTMNASGSLLISP